MTESVPVVICMVFKDFVSNSFLLLLVRHLLLVAMHLFLLASCLQGLRLRRLSLWYVVLSGIAVRRAHGHSDVEALPRRERGGPVRRGSPVDRRLSESVQWHPW